MNKALPVEGSRIQAKGNIAAEAQSRMVNKGEER
jgi:hypothetical protein